MARKNRKKIKYRVPYEIPAISNYSFSLARSIKRVESRLRRKKVELERLGEDSEYCKKYLESMIDTEFIEMKLKYDKKRTCDYRRLNDAIERRKTDKEEFSNLLSSINIEIESLNVEYSKLETLYRKYNPLYKGRLFSKEKNVDEGDRN